MNDIFTHSHKDKYTPKHLALHPDSASLQRIDESKVDNKAGGAKGEKPKRIDESLAAAAVKFDDVNQESIKHIFGWVNDGDNYHITRKPNVETMPPAYYEIIETIQGYHFRRKKLFLDELYKLPDDNVDEVINDLEVFWNSREKYVDYGLTYKRGILLPGPPGTGKSSLLNFLIHRITTEYGGIVLDFGYGIESILRQVRLMEPDMPILVIMEDVDAILSNYNNSVVLNLLDGNNQVDNIVYVATTNYPERIEPRFINRPSRFDRVIEIPLPSEEVRKFFLERKLKESDLESININKWVMDTEGLTLSHLKELIISVMVMGKDYESTLRTLKNMMDASR